MMTKLVVNMMLASVYFLNVFLNNLNITQLMITKGVSVINELPIKKNKLALPIKTRLVYFLAKTVKLFGVCSNIAQKVSCHDYTSCLFSQLYCSVD